MKSAVSTLAIRIAARFLRQADQSSGQRAKSLVKPINAPKGINKDIIRQNGKQRTETDENYVKPDKQDIRPEDVFIPKPNQVNVRNFAEGGKDQSDKKTKAQIEKDKGYDSVSNLSQYLIETQGGGGAKAQGTK